VPDASQETGRVFDVCGVMPVRNCADGNKYVRWGAVGALAVLTMMGAGCRSQGPSLVVATTTSVANSGLLDHLTAVYEEEAGISIRGLAVGSGRALRMLSLGDADVVISHAPRQEAAALAEHADWTYRKILFNDFLIVGSEKDPARVADATDAVDAFRRIAAVDAAFVSRADQSGTEEREQRLWDEAGTSLPPDRVISTGQGMSATLRIASELEAYTLTDRGTYLQLRGRLRLTELHSGDPRLLNTYAVIAPRSTPAAQTFALWLAHGRGRQELADVLARQPEAGFTVWPAGAPGARPEALPH
jgi:tungstate transport system substrate-binding protein